MKTSCFTLAALAVGSTVKAVCGAANAPGPVGPVLDRIVARVNENIITMSDVLPSMHRRLASAEPRDADASRAERIREAYEHTTRQIVRRFLVQAAYAAQKRLAIPDTAVDRQIMEIIEERYGGNRHALLEQLRRERVSFADWRQHMRRDLIYRAMIHENVERHIQVSPRAVHDYYLANRHTFTRPLEIKLRMIYLSKERHTPEAAESLAARIRAETTDAEAFSRFAREASDGSRADAGGDWGWVNPERKLRHELIAPAEALRAGTVSEPIRTEDGVYLLFAEARREAGKRPFEEVRDAIETQVRNAERERLLERWMALISRTAFVRIEPCDVELFSNILP